MSENKNIESRTTNKRNALKAVTTNDAKVDDPPHKVNVRSDVEYEKLIIYRIKHDILGYNFDNGRIIAEKTHYEHKNNIKLIPTNDKHQEIIGEILYTSKFYSKTATKELEADIVKKGLTEPLIVSIDGTVWNGNRRLAIYRKLYKEEADQEFERINIVVLPELSRKDLKKLERRLQMYKEWKQLYGSIQTRLDIRSSMNDENWEIPEIIASYGGRYKEDDLHKFVDEINLIDFYLEQIKRPKDYVFIESGNDHSGGKGAASFDDLNQILQKLRKANKSDYEIEKVKMSGLQIIHNPRSTYEDVRHYAGVMSNSLARDEFEKNSATFNDFNQITKSDKINAFGNEYLTKEYDNLDSSYQTLLNSKKSAEKLACSALKTLQKIDGTRISNSVEFRKILDDLYNQILRIRSESGG